VGHSIVTSVAPWRNWIRMGGSADNAGFGFAIRTGTKDGMTGSCAAGRVRPSASITHRRSKFAFRPLAKATDAIETPGCWHAAIDSSRKD